jgi:hypothetical protein
MFASPLMSASRSDSDVLRIAAKRVGPRSKSYVATSATDTVALVSRFVYLCRDDKPSMDLAFTVPLSQVPVVALLLV